MTRREYKQGEAKITEVSIPAIYKTDTVLGFNTFSESERGVKKRYGLQTLFETLDIPVKDIMVTSSDALKGCSLRSQFFAFGKKHGVL
mgnify:CR=1 FL=1